MLKFTSSGLAEQAPANVKHHPERGVASGTGWDYRSIETVKTVHAAVSNIVMYIAV